MPTVIISTNAAQATDVTIADMGVIVPSGGGSLTFTDRLDIFNISESDDLRSLATDDAFGVNNSTIIVNDGVSDIAQADLGAYLDNVIVQGGTGPFDIVTFDESGNLNLPTGLLPTGPTGDFGPTGPTGFTGPTGATAPAADLPLVNAYEAGGGQGVTTATALDLDTIRNSVSGFSLSGGNSVQLTSSALAGKYLVIGTFSINTTAGGVTGWEGWLSLNGSEIAGTRQQELSTSPGGASLTCEAEVDLAVNDTIALNAELTVGTGTLVVPADGVSIVIMSVEGQRGPTGPAGGPTGPTGETGTTGPTGDAASVSTTIVTATSSTSTTSATHATISGMSITPGAGTYLCIFTGTVDNNNGLFGTTTSAFQIFGNGVASGVEMQIATSFAGVSVVTVQAEVTVAAAQAIDARFRRVSGGTTVTVTNRAFSVTTTS